ncbi:hypothetical protein OV207_35745 [Corallococcus sp. BB11-1]|uniref:hypothetical protein n=1 Tax=Corallococcus sp. BB11-1 TaxID=2996783 RepID=UPI002271E617|nr:hypothetical protein [Corallococcus sp. BB11-1]MCY1036846.1 hypothetical protein [Corallococcus sp. BB11-1]
MDLLFGHPRYLLAMMAGQAHAPPTWDAATGRLASKHFDTMKRMLLWMLAGVITLTSVFVLVVVWMTRPQTKIADGFSEVAFQDIRAGETEAEVAQRLGKPLATYSEETPEEWCFENQATAQPERWIDRRLSSPSEAACLYFMSGVVQGVRSAQEGALESLWGKTADEVVRRMGKPKYIVPAGTKVTMRYSEPLEPTDSYEVFMVILDDERLVRGTQHFVYYD